MHWWDATHRLLPPRLRGCHVRGGEEKAASCRLSTRSCWSPAAARLSARLRVSRGAAQNGGQVKQAFIQIGTIPSKQLYSKQRYTIHGYNSGILTL